MMHFPLLVALAIALVAPSARAEDFRRIETGADFVAATMGRALTRLGVTLIVTPAGAIEGRAFGRSVRGGWEWRHGYFCRDLFHADEPLGWNCQLVELLGDRIRFTSDEGRGDWAEFRLR